MKYAVFTRSVWFWMLWCQVWAAFDMCLLYFDANARSNWLFLVAFLVQPVFGTAWLVLGRKRRGMVRLTAHGDGYRWEIV